MVWILLYLLMGIYVILLWKLQHKLWWGQYLLGIFGWPVLFIYLLWDHSMYAVKARSKGRP